MNTNEKIIQIEHNIPWLPQPNKGQIVLSSQIPPRELSVTSFVLAFSGNSFLQTHLVKRGWDLVGGHIELGESPEEAVRREVQEEAGATLGSLHLLGYQRLRLLGPRQAEYRYPYPDSYQIFYWAEITMLGSFSANQETHGRGLFSPTEAEQLPWVQAHRELYLAALSIVGYRRDFK
ncbi:MAG TPA: NUDIX domain-containing protein [Ktedonobacteraceae bacterium]|nr:NUDIX domain-containing protein [Ktedonobacteraceae bacterium]